MKNVGIILEMDKKTAYIITEKSEFLSLKRVSGMYCGMIVEFQPEDIINIKSRKVQYASIFSGIAALFIFAILLFSNMNKEPSIYAYMDLDINPGFQFSIDKQYEVISIAPLNEDAKGIVDSVNITKKPLQNAMKDVLIQCLKKGFYNESKTNYLLVSTALTGTDTLGNLNFEQSLEEQILKTAGKEYRVKFIQVDADIRDQSRLKGLSMGKYTLFTQLTKRYKDITLEKFKEMSLIEIFNELDHQLISSTPVSIPTGAVTKNPNPIVATKTPALKATSQRITVTPTIIVSTPAIIASTPISNKEWRVDVQYKKGEIVIYKGKEFICLQSHISQSDWKPDKTMSLWQSNKKADENWTIDVNYAVGSIVNYLGKKYRCLQYHRSQEDWKPDTTPSLWRLEGF